MTVRLVAWSAVPAGSVVWDASSAAGGDSYASVAVRWPAPDEYGRDGAWTAVYGHPSYSASCNWAGAMWSGPVGPTVPDFTWDAHDFVMTRDGVEAIATGLTADECVAIGMMTPVEVKAWCTAHAPQVADEVNTRSAAGQAEYDAQVLQALTTTPQPAAALIDTVGGTPAQARASLARLVDRGLAVVVGTGRGTKYVLDTTTKVTSGRK